MSVLIGILEDSPDRVELFKDALAAQGVTARIIDHDNAPDFLQWLEDEPHAIALISLDHDLTESTRFEDHGSGSDVVRTLSGSPSKFPVLVHTPVAEKRMAMITALNGAGWRALPAEASADGAAWAKLVKRVLSGS